jgi:ribosome assembly protein RRB1
VLKWA